MAYGIKIEYPNGEEICKKVYNKLPRNLINSSTKEPNNQIISDLCRAFSEVMGEELERTKVYMKEIIGGISGI